MKRLCSDITFNLYIANDGTFIEEATFWGISLGNARIVNESYAKFQTGTYGKWSIYQKIWGYVPED